MRIVAALRQYFADREFVEVDTATLVASPGNETHIHAFATEWIAPTGARERLYLRTSPEFACKKLLALGERRIVEFGRAFRNREQGPAPARIHDARMVLGKRVPDALMKDCANLLALAAQTTGTKTFSFRGRSMDPFAEPARATVAEALHAMRPSICSACFHRGRTRLSPEPLRKRAYASRRMTYGETYSAVSLWS